MSNERIHAAYCRCHQCAPRHPSADEISPVLRIVFLAAVMGVGLAVVAWAGAMLTNSLSSWS